MKNIAKPKLIILDFDGVVADTFALNYKIVKTLVPSLTEKKFRQHMDSTSSVGFISMIFRFLLSLYLRILYSLHLKHSSVFPDISATVQQLSKHSPIVILSSSPPGAIRRFITVNKLQGSIKEVRGSWWPRSKRAAIKSLLRRLKLQPDQCVLISDMQTDIFTGHKLGIPTVAVTWGYQNYASLEKSRPTFMVNQPEELVKLFK